MKANFLIEKVFIQTMEFFATLHIDITDFSVNFMFEFGEGYISVRVTYHI